SLSLRIEWAVFGQDPYANYQEVAVVTFRGSCAPDPWARRTSDSGSYAFTRITDGQVQPFAEVNCDRVAMAVREALPPYQYSSSDPLLGRALGRVVAHELIHILRRSTGHSSEGFQKAALSGKQLIAPDFPLRSIDLDRLRDRAVTLARHRNYG